MTDLKITTWNIKHFRKVLDQPNANLQRKRDAVIEEIRQINPDILCIIEGPGDLTLLQNFVSSPDGLNNEYHIPLIEGTDDILNTNPANARKALAKLYQMKGNDNSGNQWIWFLVKTQIYQNASNCFLQNPQVWDHFVGHTSWTVNYWGDMSTKNHRHWRHPQVLVLDLDGIRAEFVGIHLKSKINRSSPFKNGKLNPVYVEKALKARIKLATEAGNIRDYINVRFQQEPEPKIFVLGDANDGPGKRKFEKQFLFFDLLSSIQGEMFFDQDFLDHCLFDYPKELRFTTEFDGPFEEDPDKQLIDHILFTQALTDDNQKPYIDFDTGKVEHTIHDTINAMLPGPDTSDHKPVSVTIRWS